MLPLFLYGVVALVPCLGLGAFFAGWHFLVREPASHAYPVLGGGELPPDE